ncbi:hypothetical protein [Pontiella desulfatans]|uniref:hypothetical protein n=1 Tax=Pontiella desulfatans TaxID=2750659 RepID=UPI00109CA93C|nr:hypothetical protein [Pontiella desulfatans]
MNLRWNVNGAQVADAIEKTAEMGVGFLSFHAGFIDPEDVEGHATFCSRMTELECRAVRRHHAATPEPSPSNAKPATPASPTSSSRLNA